MAYGGRQRRVNTVLGLWSEEFRSDRASRHNMMEFLSLLFLFGVCASTSDSGVVDGFLNPELTIALEIMVLFPSEDYVVTSSSFLVDVRLRCYPQADPCLPKP